MAIIEELVTRLISKLYFYKIVPEQHVAIHLRGGKARYYHKPIPQEKELGLEELALIKEKGFRAFLPFRRPELPDDFYQSRTTGLPKSKKRWLYRIQQEEKDLVKEYGWWIKLPFTGIELPEGFRRHSITGSPRSLARYDYNVMGPRMVFYLPFEIDDVSIESTQTHWGDIKDLSISAVYTPITESNAQTDNTSNPEYCKPAIGSEIALKGLSYNLNVNIRYQIVDYYKAAYGPNYDYMTFMLTEARSIASTVTTGMNPALLNDPRTKKRTEQKILKELNSEMAESGIQIHQINLTDIVPNYAVRIVGLETAFGSIPVPQGNN